MARSARQLAREPSERVGAAHDLSSSTKQYAGMGDERGGGAELQYWKNCRRTGPGPSEGWMGKRKIMGQKKKIARKFNLDRNSPIPALLATRPPRAMEQAQKQLQAGMDQAMVGARVFHHRSNVPPVTRTARA